MRLLLESEVINNLTTIAMIFVAAIVAITGLFQYKLAADRFKLDIFDKRMKIFKATIDLFTLIWSRGFEDPSMIMPPQVLDDDMIRKYENIILTAKFLFDDETANYIELIGKKAGELSRLRMVCNENIGDANYNDEAILELRGWFSRQEPKFTKIFKKYMKFNNWHKPFNCEINWSCLFNNEM